MESRIKEWLENLDLLTIKSPNEMKLRYHAFITACKGDGLDVSGHDDIASLGRFLARNHVALRTNDSKPKKIKSIYHAVKTCSSEDESRKVLHGFLITEKRNQIVATDGRRLLSLPYSGSLDAGAWDLYNGKALKTLQYMTPDEYKVAMKDDNHPIHFTSVVKDYFDLTYADGYWFKKCEGTYPNYQSVIPDDDTQVPAGAITQGWFNGLKSALYLQKLLELQDHGTVSLNLKVMQPTESGGRELQDIPVSLNACFLNDGFEVLLQFSNGEKIILDCDATCASISPLVFSAKCGAMYVVMPMRGDNPNDKTFSGFAINKMQSVTGEKPKEATPVQTVPAQVETVPEEAAKAEVPAIESPAPVETPVQVEPEVPAEIRSAADVIDVPAVPADVSSAPVVRFTPGLPDSDNDAPETTPAAPADANKPIGSKYTWAKMTPEERMVNNLKFEQLTFYKNVRRMESRLAFIHRILDEGEKLILNAFTDKKKGKLHYTVNGNFLGKNAYEYAERLINGGERIVA